MANFVMSRARKLFDYSDLNGSTTSTTTTTTTTTTNRNIMEGSASINVDDAVDDFRNATTVAKARRKRKCIVAFTAIFGLMAIIVIAMSVKQDSKVTSALKNLPAAFSSATSSSSNSDGEDRRVRVGDVSHGRFYTSKWNGTWISGFEFVFPDSDGGISIFNIKALNTTNILSAGKMDHFKPYDYTLSSDKEYLLIKRSSRRVFRRSSYGEYAVLSLHDGVMTPLKPSNLSRSPNSNTDAFLLRYVSWSPQGNALVYVDYNNNLYYRKSVMSQDDKLTTNGEVSKIYNAIPDWVFEEEVFEDNTALWWSPDATKLVWGSFDDTDVDVYVLPEYGPWTKINQFPNLSEVRYPKVNGRNPKSSLWLTDFSNGNQKKQILPPTSLANEGEVHFSHVTWADFGKKFAVTWMNRVQNKTVITLCDVNDLDCSSSSEIFSREEPHGWIPYKYRIHFNPKPPNPKNKDFVTILAAPFLKHHYRQLVYLTDGSRTYLTKVDGAEVIEILKWTMDGYIYYMSTLPLQPGTRHLYRIRAPPNARSQGVANVPECITCNRTMTDVDREQCQYYSVDMSKDGSFMTMICLGPDVPYACIHHTPSLHYIKTFEMNMRTERALAHFDMPILQFLEIPVSGSDQKAQVKLMLPPDFDSSQKYPLIVYAYGGPGFQSVDQKFNWNDLGTYMAGSAGMIYAIVDPQGSGYQGEDWRFATYHAFGTAEVQSLTEVAKHLQDNMNYIDKDKTGVWGWSYGGYLSLMTLAKDTENVFKCGASVAPVADWTLYDTYYTERYMGLNKENDNLAGYNTSSAFHYLENLRTKSYYLLHGTHDDNVHYQNSMLLSAALEEMDILFRQQAYPDQDHSIPKYRLHLDHSLANFFLNECFDKNQV